MQRTREKASDTGKSIPDKNSVVFPDTNNINSNSHDVSSIVLSVLHKFFSLLYNPMI